MARFALIDFLTSCSLATYAIRSAGRQPSKQRRAVGMVMLACTRMPKRFDFGFDRYNLGSITATAWAVRRRELRWLFKGVTGWLARELTAPANETLRRHKALLAGRMF